MIALPPLAEVTPEQLLGIPEGDRYELLDGQLVERDMGAESSWIATEISRRLGNFCSERKIAWLLGADASYQCFRDRPDRVRRPDVSLIRFGRLADEKLPRGHIPITPDLVVEVVSPNDLFESVEAKMVEFLNAGVPVGWLLMPNLRMIAIYRPDGSTRLREDDQLQGEGPLEGFSFRVGGVFPPQPPAQSGAD